MLGLLRRLLGWDVDSDDLDLGLDDPPAPRAISRQIATPKPVAPHQEQARPKVRDELELGLNAPAQTTGFDPYNTGAFDRSASWEKIAKSKGR